MSEAPAMVPPESGDDEKMPVGFGKYTLIRKLAVGGMAELFLALQRSVAGFEKLIVVKRVLPQLAKDETFIEMLLTEARIAATLNHPNVAHIYDVGSANGQYFIAMEHIHGEDLRSLVRQMKKKEVTGFPLEHALAVVLGCCAGLAYAHEQRDLDGEPMGIVHRDVSPQNILVTFGGDVKLVDFGIAKAGFGTMETTGSGQLKGKVPYMSPEQANGESLDARSDIFSLGIILFELSTGRRLFRGQNELETLRKIVEHEYPRPRDLNPNLSPRLEEIILRALEKDRTRRYQSARDMQADLEDYIRAEQLKVGALSLGAWMQELFREKRDAQKQMLQEGRQLAEVLASQAAEERESAAADASGSGVRARNASRLPVIVLAIAIVLASATGLFVFLRSSGGTGPGVIALSSTPPGAAIWIDGERRSERTPASIEGLPVGAVYSVKLTRDGFAPHTQRVPLTEERQRAVMNAALRRDVAVLRVRTIPAGARVLLDGRDLQQTTPATIPEVAAGEPHTLALMLDGYVAHSQPLTLEAGAVEELSFTLQPTPLAPGESILRVVTEPASARVQLDGAWHSSGSPYEFRGPTRRVRIAVSNSGFRPVDREIALSSGRVSEVRIALERDERRRPVTPVPTASGEPGRLTFDSRPWCNVSIDGRSVGQTPIVNHQLSAGRHSVTCENPQAGSQRLTVNIAPGETVRRAITLP